MALSDAQLDRILDDNCQASALSAEVSELIRLAAHLEARVSGLSAIRLPDDNPQSVLQVVASRIEILRAASETLTEMAGELQMVVDHPDLLAHAKAVTHGVLDRDVLKAALSPSKGQA